MHNIVTVGPAQQPDCHSNRRIVKLENDRVAFRYRETETGQLKSCTLPAELFIHRSLQYVLPRRLVKVRYYGFLAVGQRKRLAALRQQLSCSAEETSVATEYTNEESPRSRWTEVRCPSCGQVMQRGAVIRPTAHSPPRRPLKNPLVGVICTLKTESKLPFCPPMLQGKLERPSGAVKKDQNRPIRRQRGPS